MLVNGKPLTSFPLYLDKKRKMYVLDLPPRLVDESIGLWLEAYRGIARIRQNPDENIEVEICVSEERCTINVYGVVHEDCTIKALGIYSIKKLL